jgi:hypothetical protein
MFEILKNETGKYDYGEMCKTLRDDLLDAIFV